VPDRHHDDMDGLRGGLHHPTLTDGLQPSCACSGSCWQPRRHTSPPYTWVVHLLGLDGSVVDTAVPDSAVIDTAVIDTAVIDTAVVIVDSAVPDTRPDSAVPDLPTLCRRMCV